MRLLWLSTSVAVLACVTPDDADLGDIEQSIVAGEELRGVVSSSFGPDVNRYVPRLVQQVRELKDHGDYSGYYTGNGPPTYCAVYPCKEHWQGIVRLAYPPAARDHLVAVSSDDDASYLSVIPTPPRAGLRLRGNRHSTTTPDW